MFRYLFYLHIYFDLAEVLPTFDRDRVYPSDIKKLIVWYNLLVASGMTDFEETPAAETKEESKAE